jgi:hypothetical protein
MSNKIISKTRYMSGLQCRKLLWVSTNDKARLPDINASTQSIFDQGHDVGYLAQKLFPDGIVLSQDYSTNLKATRESLSRRQPLFEAGFNLNRLCCFVDILNPAGEDEWEIIEVKSSTEVKTEHLHDVAFQRHVCRISGLNINRCHVIYINNQYVRHGEIDPKQLFIIEDVTDRLEEYARGMEKNIESMLSCVDSGICPDGVIGRNCDTPYPCGLKTECWAHLPEQHVMTLSYGKKLGEELMARGILDIRDIPADIELNDKQRIQRDCAICREPHVKPSEVRGFLKKLEYPLYFMDFETFQTAIPLYDGTKPYQQIPFQFSLHVVYAPGALSEHYSYLHDGQDDPRPRFLEELSQVIGTKGSMLVYFQAFEEGRLKEAAEVFPQHRQWIENARTRMVDLLAPFKGFLYYHPDQCGSASLKQVMPALTGISYDELEINEGSLASARYLEATFGISGKEVTHQERQKIRQDLLVYCGQDTGGMVEVLKRLGEIAA